MRHNSITSKAAGLGVLRTLPSFLNSCATAAMMCGSSLQRLSASTLLARRCGRGAMLMASAQSTPLVGFSCRGTRLGQGDSRCQGKKTVYLRCKLCSS